MTTRAGELPALVDALVRTRPDRTAIDVAVLTARVAFAGHGIWTRLRAAWRIIR